MLKKIFLITWFLIVGILVLNIIFNQNMPLGFDHGPYKYFISSYESQNGNIAELSQRLQAQFEPFSGTFLYYLKIAAGENMLFTWLYLGVHILISIVFFILAKHHGKYSLGSILGLLLFIVSSVQYGNYAGALGKQIFATLFLLLSIRYQKKIFLNSVFLIACISLHRLTGFIAILFSFFSLLSERKSISNTKYIILGGIISLAIINYLPSFGTQILPYLNTLIYNIGDNIFIPGRYGSGFSRQDFWFFEIPLLLLTILGVIYSHTKNRFHLLKSPYFLTFGCIAILVLFRGIAHSRLQSFFDLFLLLIFILYASAHISKKWIYILLSLHLILWFGIFRHDHTSAISREEAQIIKKIVRGAPENVYLVSLSSGYRALMTGYGHRDFRDEYSHILSQKTKKDTIKLSKDKDFLCHKLSQLDKEVFLYRGAQEKILSPLNNPCLHVIKTWRNGAQFMRYYKE